MSSTPLEPEWAELGIPEDDTAEPDDAGDDDDTFADTEDVPS